MRPLDWLSLPFMLWVLCCPGFARDSQTRSVASMAYQSSPPGGSNKHQSFSIRMRKKTREGIYLEYRHDSEKHDRTDNTLVRLGMVCNLISQRYWHADLNGGTRIMNQQAGYEMGFILDNFSWMPVGLHLQFNAGNLEGTSFYDVSTSIGVIYVILEFNLGYRHCYIYNKTSREPFIGCYLWM